MLRWIGNCIGISLVVWFVFGLVMMRKLGMECCVVFSRVWFLFIGGDCLSW